MSEHTLFLTEGQMYFYLNKLRMVHLYPSLDHDWIRMLEIYKQVTCNGKIEVPEKTLEDILRVIKVNVQKKLQYSTGMG